MLDRKPFFWSTFPFTKFLIRWSWHFVVSFSLIQFLSSLDFGQLNWIHYIMAFNFIIFLFIQMSFVFVWPHWIIKYRELLVQDWCLLSLECVYTIIILQLWCCGGWFAVRWHLNLLQCGWHGCWGWWLSACFVFVDGMPKEREKSLLLPQKLPPAAVNGGQWDWGKGQIFHGENPIIIRSMLWLKLIVDQGTIV